MATNPLAEIRSIRINKAAQLRELGLNPFPAKAHRTHYAADILSNFPANDGQAVTVSGRLMSFRKQGALAFAHVQDQTGKIQFFMRRNVVQPTDKATGSLGFAEMNLVDLGDIVEASGKVMKTERGEISVMVDSFRLLTKALRPLPDQWSGLKDREQILRKRYLDTTLEKSSHERFAGITRMIASIRQFLGARGFLEFQTPAIQPQYGGGTAKPFKTHVNALGCEMYLAISHELYLKRLIAGGYDKVFTIGRYFRNEGIDRSHHPEFSMVETMTAYENYEYNMNLVEDMFRHVAVTAFGKTQFQVKGHTVDFALPWTRIAMSDAVKSITGLDFKAMTTVDEANAALAALGVHEAQPSIGEAMVAAFEAKVEETLIQPTLVHGHPIEISPLAKPMAEDPRFVERFEIFIAGMECGDNWSEQNDPVKLLETWRKNYRPEDRDSGDFHCLDFDFIEALEYGIPPTTGIGPGLERMAMIFTEQENIDDVIFFPLMRPTVSSFNAAIFGIDAHATEPVEDLAVTIDEFCELIGQGVLKPVGSRLTFKPHVTVWQVGAKWRASGHVEVEGVAKHGVVHLAGYAGLVRHRFCCRRRNQETRRDHRSQSFGSAQIGPILLSGQNCPPRIKTDGIHLFIYKMGRCDVFPGGIRVNGITQSPDWCIRLYESKAAELVLYGRALGLSHAESEDVLQETFTALMRLPAEPDNGLHYGLRAFRNRCLNHKKSLWRRLTREMESKKWFEREESLDPREESAVRCLQTLPPDQREVIVLKVWHQHTFEEIAAILEISPNTAAGRYRYGMQKLRILPRR